MLPGIGGDVSAAVTLTWDAAADFGGEPDEANPAPDSYGNAGVWSYMQGTPNNPATYTVLSTYSPGICSNSAVDQWEAPGVPAVRHNRDATSASCATNVIPAGAVDLHPSNSAASIVAWKSPMKGAVSVTGGVTDDDGGGGNGIDWWIDKGSTTLASGGFNNGGSQTFASGTGGDSLASIAVEAGDALYLIVGSKGDHGFDATRADLTISGSPSATCLGKPVTILGTDDPETITGTPSADVIVALGGDDQITADDGADTICGNGGSDTISAGAGADSVDGAKGSDEINGEGGKDRIFGRTGDDTLTGGDTRDRIFGGNGGDTIRGGDGDDVLSGDADDDFLFGENGADSLDGGSETDECSGGPDVDSGVNCETEVDIP
jgi:Ca2+-binding RTX toxin-like protein